MPDNIFHESMSQEITCWFFVFVFLLLFFLVRGDNSCFPQDERGGISFITVTSVGMGKS